MTLRLLHEEYLHHYRASGMVAVGKSKFYDDYARFCNQTGFSNRIIHRASFAYDDDLLLNRRIFPSPLLVGIAAWRAELIKRLHVS